jgi:hypothetical protein
MQRIASRSTRGSTHDSFSSLLVERHFNRLQLGKRELILCAWGRKAIQPHDLLSSARLSGPALCLAQGKGRTRSDRRRHGGACHWLRSARAEAIARSFKLGRKVSHKIAAILAALTRVGYVTTTDGGQSFALRRAA